MKKYDRSESDRDLNYDVNKKQRIRESEKRNERRELTALKTRRIEDYDEDDWWAENYGKY